MNVKAGQMAYIARSSYPENIGTVCEVLRLAPRNEWEGDHLPEWECKSSKPISGMDMSNGLLGYSMIFNCPDAWLRPISGVPVHDEQHDEVKEPV